MKKGIAALTIVAALVGAAPAAPPQDQSFRSPRISAMITNPPGSIVSATPFRIAIPGARAWRIAYRSSGINGEQVVDSGVIVAPSGTPPPNGWPVVAWAHPTTGIARKCAPSLGANFEKTVPELPELVRRGFVVAATDYQGLGAEGPHPYLVGTSAAYAVLDSVRAARTVAGAGSRFVAWGHSQGGHAALWTGQLATQYAPDLSLLGVAAAAPATELAQLLRDDINTPGGKAFSALALLSWSNVYGLDLSTVIASKAMAGTHLIGDTCMTSPLGLMVDALGLRMLPSDFLRADPTRVPPLSDIIVRNTPSSVARGVPVFFAQGTADTVISPAVTRDFARRLCRDGTPVRLAEMNADHLSVATLSAPEIVDWISARFSGNRMENGCAAPPFQ